MTGSKGESGWSARRQVVFGLLVLLVLVGGFGGWAVSTEIAGAIVSSGRIEVDQNRQVVQHIDGGIVSEVRAEEGDHVEQGDVLVRLDGDELASELAIVEGQLYELMARRGRLEAERGGADTITFAPELLEVAAERPEIAELVEGQRNLFAARRASLDREVEQLERRRAQIASQIDGIESQQAALTRQLELMREELADQQTLLDSGLAQKSRLLALQREEARLLGQIGELEASRAESEGRITEIEIQILGLENRRREEAITELRDIRSRESELAERRHALRNQLARLDIAAPVGGVVYDLQVHGPGAVIRPADPVLYIVPQDRPLIVAARIDPIHIDQVFPGQEVNLRFSALDMRHTPELVGTVVQVSADAFTDEARGESYYRAELILKDGEMAKLPEGVTLLPGMPVEAFLRTEDRTPLAYLVKPLTDYFVKAFRES